MANTRAAAKRPTGGEEALSPAAPAPEAMAGAKGAGPEEPQPGRSSGTRPAPLPRDGRVRPVVAHVAPTVEGGDFPAKRIVGDAVAVSADAFADGHDLLVCQVRFRHHHDAAWSSCDMEALGNDRFQGSFAVGRTGRYDFSVRAGIDRFSTWVQDLEAKVAAGQEVATDVSVGVALLGSAARRARGAVGRVLREAATRLEAAAWATEGGADALEVVRHQEVATAARRFQDAGPWASSPVFSVEVDRYRAGFSSWYELFPRSASPDPHRPGTLKDVEDRLGYLARLGFDVVYLPPIHPIGRTNRKGPDGATVARAGDPGSPWAIGSDAGGHTAVDPGLGEVADIERLVGAAAQQGMEIALDLAFQCSPDHPWVHEHPQWFRHLPDGTIAFAENPPKRYEDIYPLDFETEDWAALWEALKDVVLFWVHRGIHIFRVDNPHTKPMGFWRWLIPAVRSEHPDVLFLSEAFTRPRIMEHLAKIGFSQSYTYFTWRNTKWELESYLGELTGTEVAEYLRPNLWPNTPDILHATLQHGGRGAFMARLILAATLSANYGIYGPVFELQEHQARHRGSEEYLHSEKYEIRHWDLEAAGSLADLVARVNHIRRDHRALQQDRTLGFHHIDNDRLIAYSKRLPAADGRTPDTILVVVNLDPYGVQSGWTSLDLDALGLEAGEPFEVHDLLTDARYQWRGPWNYVALDPDTVPAHLFSVRQDPR